MSDLPGTCLSAYLDRQLLPADARSVRRHLEQCTDCRGRLSELGDLVVLVRSGAPDGATADLAPGILAAAAAVDARRERAAVRSRHLLGAGLLVASAAGFALAARRSAPVLLGSAVWRMGRAVVGTGLDLPAFPDWLRVAVLAALLGLAWGASRRLQRALRQAGPGVW